MSDPSDRDLGMHRNITRRDFLNGVAVTAAAYMLPHQLLAAAQCAPPLNTSSRPLKPKSFPRIILPPLQACVAAIPVRLTRLTACATTPFSKPFPPRKIPAKPTTLSS